MWYNISIRKVVISMYLTLLVIGIILTVVGCIVGTKYQWNDHASWIIPLVVGAFMVVLVFTPLVVIVLSAPPLIV